MKKLQTHLLCCLILLLFSCSEDFLLQKEHVGKVSVKELFKLRKNWVAKKDHFKFSGEIEWKPEYSVRAYIGTWCHDSKREIPRLMKVLESSGIPEDSIEIYLVSKNKKMPEKEILSDRIFYTPTILILKHGKEVERFVEHPFSSWVNDLNKVLGQEEE